MGTDYKKMYEETNKELQELKLKADTPKKTIVKEIAKIFGENPIKIEKYNFQDREESYESFKGIYGIMFNRISKDDLLELLSKIRNLGETRT